MSGDADRKFAPTAKKRRDAAAKGDVLRSRDAANAVAFVVGVGWLLLAGPMMVDSLAGLLRSAFTFDAADVEDFNPSRPLMRALSTFLPLILTLALPVTAATALSQLAARDGRWLPGNIGFKASRVDPMAGLRRLFGLNGLVEAAKGILKVAVLGALTYSWATHWLSAIVGLGRSGLGQQLPIVRDALTALIFHLAAGLVLIALVDVPLQLFRRHRRLMMSEQEMRDEHKESEGSPEARAHRRQRQRDIAAGSVAHAMREAQFVVTNPTHFAIAITYDPVRAPAPIVLAKGRGEKALAMREMARELNVPLLEYPALARSLYYTSRETQIIRSELYGAIATVLAYVFSLKRGQKLIPPVIDVPATLRFDADGRQEA